MSIKVEAFSSPGCAKCARARDTLKAVVEELGEKRATWRDVNILEEMDYAVELGILSPPAIAIDGELIFPALPSPSRLRAELIKRVEKSR
ncbi:MAG: thioredoxin family protein [Betaproteobacteria bacterium]|nr:thioredoxin family protein [Betaproteobacteria bacterium]MBI3054644.1 thioredoxin family protein [Betaproteobacteria bacterium]